MTTPEGPDAIVELAALTIDCQNADKLGTFYATALGGTISHRDRESLYVKANGMALICRTVADYKAPTWPSAELPMHFHFEFVADDPDAAAMQLQRLGATVAAHQDPDDPDLVVMLDPAAHPFCVIRRSAVVRL